MNSYNDKVYDLFEYAGYVHKDRLILLAFTKYRASSNVVSIFNGPPISIYISMKLFEPK